MSLDDIEYRVHAVLGPSGAKKWSSCTAAPGAEARILEDSSHERTRYGTTGHLVLAECLEHGHNVESYLDRVLNFYVVPKRQELWLDEVAWGLAGDDLGDALPLHTVTVDQEMVDKTATIIKFVQDLVLATGGTLSTEQRLSIEHITKERGACGTTDVGIANRRGREFICLDAKYGFMRVLASEDGAPNLQLAMYADAWLHENDPLGLEFDTVRLIIAQPFVTPPFNEAVFTRAELVKTITWLSERAEKTRTNPEFSPSYETCLWCKAKATCSARTRVVLEAAADGFTDVQVPHMLTHPFVEGFNRLYCGSCGKSRHDVAHAISAPVEQPLPTLGEQYEMIAMIRDWCDDVDKRVKNELRAGRPVVGKKGPYKMIAGAQGDRKWIDPDRVAKMLDEEYLLPAASIYSTKVNSPAKIEALAKGKKAQITVDGWAELTKSIVRGESGAPRVVLSSDDAPPLADATDGFCDVEIDPFS